MTNPKVDLQALVGKSADADFLNEIIGFVAQRLMKNEVGGLTSDRDWETRADTAKLRIPH